MVKVLSPTKRYDRLLLILVSVVNFYWIFSGATPAIAASVAQGQKTDANSIVQAPVTFEQPCGSASALLHCNLGGDHATTESVSLVACRIGKGPWAAEYSSRVTSDNGREFQLRSIEGPILLMIPLPLEFLDDHIATGVSFNLTASCGKIKLTFSSSYVAAFLSRFRASLDPRLSPLLAAVIGGDRQLTARLLDTGQDPNLKTSESSPLQRAASMGHRKIAQLLVSKGADLEQRDEFGRTAMHLAAIQGDPVTVQVLLNGGAKVNTQDSTGCLPLGYALRHKNTQAADILQRQGGLAALPQSVTVGKTRYPLSTKAQQHLLISKIVPSKHQPSGSWVLIVGEPHYDATAQWDIYQGLNEFLGDNPTLPHSAVFLGEGLMAGETLSVAPLLLEEPTPTQREIRTILESYLIPGYVAYAWRSGGHVPIEGIEDRLLYEASASSWANGRDAEHLVTVAARNVSIARVVTEHVEQGRSVVLFVGRGHVRTIVANEFESNFAAFRKASGKDETRTSTILLKTRNVGVGELLNSAGIGYTLVEAANEDPPDVEKKHAARYRSLFRAQSKGAYDDYIGSLNKVAP